MGFQGDVAGIGLGELLQGLSRGGREGVLTLHGQNQTVTLGVQQGQIFLLPEPNEDPDLWRQRVRRAWVRDPNERIDTIRMSDVAFAARLEQAFTMLDCEGVHFRFEPGPLPSSTPPPPEIVGLDSGEQPQRAQPVHCPGIAVEYLLLEHARLSDESQGHGPRLRLALHDVPRILDASRVVKANQRFCSECDGMSNIVEIADRLSWPLRQCRAWAEEMIAQGVLRLSDARELLVQAQHELHVDQFARAASRLAGWVLRAPPGPPPGGDVQLLSTAWIDGKLQTVLGFMEPRLARRLLRRMELVERDPRMAYERWRELRKHHRHDRLAEVRMLGWQLRSDDDTIAPALTDLLKLARNFQDEGRLRRAGVMLRAAAARLPETTSMRLELGNRLMSVGLVADGAPWVLEACRTLIQSGHAEKALAPLRAVMTFDGANREARSLLMQARARSARGRRRRRILIIASSVLFVLSLLGLVQLRMEHRQDKKLSEVERIEEPRLALARLNDLFPDSQAASVAGMRAKLVAGIQKEEGLLRDAWMEGYREAELECTLGDPILGLKRVFDLEQPPRTEYLEFEWPRRSALMHALASKLEQDVAEWDASPEEPQGELAAEERLIETLGGLRQLVDQNKADPEVDGFDVRLDGLNAAVVGRREKREAVRSENARNALQQEQDLLLAAARAHEKAGDLERAVMAFRKLLATPESDLLRRALRDEIEGVELHYNALVEARRLAQKGEHRRGLEVLREHCPNPTEHQLPSQIESEPAGAVARFADGTTHTTPFTIETSPGEDVVIVLELAGHEDQRIEMREPGDQFALMSRLPSLWWRTTASVDAVPTFVGGDYILGDRGGRLVRLSGDSRAVWEKRLDSLGGLARAPVFLPALPSHMLAITEDGQAWLVEAQSGNLEGPWSLPSPPWQGPLVEGQVVVVRCSDGSVARWSARLKPEVEEVDPLQPKRVEGEAFGPSAGLEVLRRRSGTELTLRSPWSTWQVTVEEQNFVVQDTQKPMAAFRVRLQDPWAYVAWEAPSAKLPNGRLWLSDGTGVRGFEPQ